MNLAEDERTHETRLRAAMCAAYDALPPELRQALRECPYDVHILRPLPRDMDCTAMIAAIGRIGSEDDAMAFMQAHMPRRWGAG